MPERAGNSRSRAWCRRAGRPAGGSAPSRSSTCRSISLPPRRSGGHCFPHRDREPDMPNPARRLKPRAVVFAVALLLLLAPGLALAAPAGTVVGLSGASVVESAGSRGAVKLGQPVQVGDTVEVPPDGKLKLRMADGSVISVAAGTRLTIAAYGVDADGQRQEARLSLAQGLLRALVAPVERPASFEVDTAVGAAAVRSTDWFVEGSATAMQVGVLSGSVEMMSRATRHAVTIPPRWGARMESGRDPVPPRVWSQAEFDAVTARTDVK